MWDRGDFRICGRDFVELGKNRDLGIGYDHGSQPEFWLHRLIRLNQNAQIFIGKQFFLSIHH